ncbi:hypothetical protein ASPWEDRAFT_50901 [Aspergillus wentii DTO 134E9]|uniref:tryptophan synthase n=1 Tax=Aspergillus wentii DTO 134E9 TaxID=1073089 RepID=A0A1L9RSM3_ASPWE|nr:uncharacterized protein ASPWEDRAFT_50901 [Aspergillus wentii DTO 134E9]OJJ37894.1 hypothetical protein ASPWEDRAFT_50901 [Aspergillus wentii DTO 134E9]
MEQIKQSFAKAKQQNHTALGAYVTAGYPTGPIGMIELCMLLTDPIADGPIIQEANTIALAHGVTVSGVLDMVPILLMRYYNSVLCYGEVKLLEDCKQAGINGFILVDLPVEEAIPFRKLCASNGLPFIPLIAPSTSISRIKSLCSLADSFIHAVSRMGVTGCF